MIPGSSQNERTGEVFLDSFDRGVIYTLGAVISSDHKMVVIKGMDGVEAPPNYEGVPIFFAFPDENLEEKILPSIVVRRDSISPAMSRWHLGSISYNVPAAGARPVTYTHPITGAVIAQGFDTYERKDQAVPYDLVYTIQIRARFRNNLRVESLKMLKYVMKKYQPYTQVAVVDSLEHTRYYDAFNETPTDVVVMPDLTGRESNFNVTLRVEAELDLNDPYNVRVLTSGPTIITSLK
jgi:hypothetical protein